MTLHATTLPVNCQANSRMIKHALLLLILLLLAQICQAVGRYICMVGALPARLIDRLNLFEVQYDTVHKGERRRAAHQYRRYRQILLLLFLGQARCVLLASASCFLPLALLNLPMPHNFTKAKTSTTINLTSINNATHFKNNVVLSI